MNITHFRELTRFEHTIFGLPIMLTGGLLAFLGDEKPRITLPLFLWILLAFLSARIAGMAFNQWIDREIDEKNQRTAGRVLPTKRVKLRDAQLISWLFLALFLFASSQINELCLKISPLAAFCIFIYSYLKRWSVACHFMLGFIHFLTPVMAWIALMGSISWPPVLLGFSMLFFISSSDIIYALQDIKFDRKNKLFSIPSRYGLRASLMITRILHILSFSSLFMMALFLHTSMVYFIGVFLIGILYIYFHLQLHTLLRTTQFKGKIANLFFLSTSLFGFIVFLFSSLEWLWRGI